MANVDFGAHYKRFVRYFWDPEPKNDDPTMSPIWCLGQQYSAERVFTSGASQSDRRNGAQAEEQETEDDAVVVPSLNIAAETSKCNRDGSQQENPPTSAEELGWPSDFLEDFESRFWFTYRSNFTPIEKSRDTSAASSLTLAVRWRSQLLEQGGFTSDTGWGCMIRSGQCLISNALLFLKLGRSKFPLDGCCVSSLTDREDWRRGSNPREERQIISLFGDDPKAPFSIHRFVEHGASACGKHPGEWFGPSATSRCIQYVVLRPGGRTVLTVQGTIPKAVRTWPPGLCE